MQLEIKKIGDKYRFYRPETGLPLRKVCRSVNNGCSSEAQAKQILAAAGYEEHIPVPPGPTIEFVDLGLPSGTLWMAYNLGATAVTDYGLYYQWGATTGYPAYSQEGKNHSTWSTAPFNGGAASYDASYWAAHKSEVVDSNNILLPANDCVYQATNGDAKLPTKAQIEELCNLESKEWKENYNGSGINGWEFTGNGQTLFVPAAGYFGNGLFGGAGDGFDCWSCSLFSDYESSAWRLSGRSDGVGSDYDNRCRGYSARGVQA